MTSVISFFVAVCTQTQRLRFFLLVQAPQNLSQSLMLRIRHKRVVKSVGTAHWVTGCEDI
jgi:hypothetical protein